MNPQPSPDLPADVVLRVNHVSKKFCRNLKRSMLYGMQDLAANLVGLRPRGARQGDHRPETIDHRPGEEEAEAVRPDLPQSNVYGLKSKVSPDAGLRRDEFWALRDISFDLRKGECLGLIGPNGSGKTTLLRLLTGIFPPDEGEIIVKGRTGAMIALGAGFHPHLTGRENIYLNGAILGLNRHEIDAKLNEIVDFAEIEGFIDAPVSTYSSGMYVRLGFSVAAFQNPDILLVDEVLAVGDAGFREKCMNMMVKFLDNTAIVFVSHSIPMVVRMCNRILLMEHGRIKYLAPDVSRGIEMYNNLFKHSSEMRIAGSGRVTLIEGVQVLLRGVNGEVIKTNVIPCRATMIVCFRLRPQRSITRVQLALTISRKGGEYAAYALSRDEGVVVDLTGQDLYVTVETQNLLTPGEYNLSVSVHDETKEVSRTHVGENLGYFINACQFVVPVDRPISAAPVQFPCRWNIEQGRKSAGPSDGT